MQEIEALAVHSDDDENNNDEAQSQSSFEQQCILLPEESKSNLNLIDIYFVMHCVIAIILIVASFEQYSITFSHRISVTSPVSADGNTTVAEEKP